ncbi:hypothetical protein ACFFQA_28270 [Allokutzneria oryzae]|uniref:Uncharacterized protein n=1 Tax=Allokutzneria oryzae TaxID=1378989 RepID=A0ABV6A6G1_9PSEU
MRNTAENITGALVQAGKIEGDVTLHVARDPLEVHDVPVVITVEWSETEYLVQFAEDRPAHGDGLSGRWRGWTEGLAVLVEGRSARAVVLKALRPVVLARRPPRPIAGLGRACGILEPRRFIVDLERDPPGLVAQGPDFPFTVSASDPEQFRIRLRVRDHEVDWRLELDWICAGRAGTLQIPETGHFTHYPIRSRLEESKILTSEVVRLLQHGHDRPVRVGQVRVDPCAEYRSQVVALRATFADLGEVDVPVIPGELRLHAYPAGDALEPAGEPLAAVELDESVYNDGEWGPVNAIAQALAPRLR